MSGLFSAAINLFKLLFHGIYQVMTGGFGSGVALLAWLQIVLQFILATGHTSSLGGALALGGVLYVGLALSALLTFMIFNGAAFEPNVNKKQTASDLTITAALLSIFAQAVYTSIAIMLLGRLVNVHGILGAVIVDVMVAALQSVLISRTLLRLAGSK